MYGLGILRYTPQTVNRQLQIPLPHVPKLFGFFLHMVTVRTPKPLFLYDKKRHMNKQISISLRTAASLLENKQSVCLIE
jgi:hypothetical protein